MNSIIKRVLRYQWEAPPWMARNERPTLDVDEMHCGDGYRIRLRSFRENRDGDIIESTYRTAIYDYDPKSAMSDQRHAVALGGIVRYLIDLIFPRPLPTFRIRTRGPKRLAAGV